MPVLSDDSLMRLLDDDTHGGDLTTHSLGIGSRQGRFEFRARQAMCVCAVEEAARMCQLCGVQVEGFVKSGAILHAGELILSGEGTAADLHRVWKAAQVLMEWASGIATGAAGIVAVAGGGSCCLHTQECARH